LSAKPACDSQLISLLNLPVASVTPKQEATSPPQPNCEPLNIWAAIQNPQTKKTTDKTVLFQSAAPSSRYAQTAAKSNLRPSCQQRLQRSPIEIPNYPAPELIPQQQVIRKAKQAKEI